MVSLYLQPLGIAFFLNFQLSHLVLHGVAAFFHSTTFHFMSATNNADAFKWPIMAWYLYLSVTLFFECIWRVHMHNTPIYENDLYFGWKIYHHVKILFSKVVKRNIPNL